MSRFNEYSDRMFDAIANAEGPSADALREVVMKSATRPNVERALEIAKQDHRLATAARLFEGVLRGEFGGEFKSRFGGGYRHPGRVSAASEAFSIARQALNYG